MAGQPGSIRAGRAYVELFADGTLLASGLRKAELHLKAFGASVRGIGTELAAAGGAVVTPLIASAKAYAAIGDNLVHVSRRTGIAVETLSELSFAAGQCGVEAEAFETGIRRMQKTLVEAAKGSASAQESLGMLGVTIKDLDGLSPDEQFKRIADRLAGIEDPTIRAATAMQVFGRNGTALLPMMAAGAEGIDALCKQAKALGLTISTEDAEAAHGFSQALDVLWKVLKQGVFVVGSALAPALRDVARWTTELVVRGTAWLKQNKDLVLTVFKVAVAAVAGGVALIGLGWGISFVGSAVGVALTIFKGFTGVLGLLRSGLMLLLTPLTLVDVAFAAMIVGAAGLIVSLLRASGMIGAALQWLGDRFGDLKADAIAAYQGIAAALARGDIATAAKVLWLTLKYEWAKGTAALDQIANQWATGALILHEDATAAMTTVWLETYSAWRKLWLGFTSWHRLTVESWANWFAKRMVEVHGLATPGFDVKAAKQNIDESSAVKFKEIEGEAGARANTIESERKLALAAAFDVHAAKLRQIDAEGTAREKAIAKELQDARDQWQAVLGEVQAGGATAGGPGGISESLESLIRDFASKFGAASGGLEDLADQIAKRTIEVHGTFNAAAIQGLQAGGISDRALAAAERTAKAVEGLRSDLRDKGLVFSD